MDKSKDGQIIRVHRQEGPSDNKPESSSQEHTGECKETDSPSGAEHDLNKNAWKHDQKIDFSNLIDGLRLIQSALEKTIEHKKIELAEIQSRISQFNK